MALRKRKKEDKQAKVTTTATTAATADKPARNSLLSMFIMMLLVFLVGAGMVIGYFKFIDPAGGSANANVKDRPVKETTMSSMELGDMVVNLADRNGSHFIKTKIVVEYPEDKKTVELVEEKKSHIIEAVLLTLRKKTVDEIKPPEATEKLKQELVKAINNRLEDEVIERVIFTQYIVQ